MLSTLGLILILGDLNLDLMKPLDALRVSTVGGEETYDLSEVGLFIVICFFYKHVTSLRSIAQW